MDHKLTPVRQTDVKWLTSEGEEYPIEMKVLSIDYDEGLCPEYATWGSACADVYSAEDVKLEPYSTTAVYTGFRVAIDKGWEMQIRSRSGMASRGIMIANGIGTIDSDYRGPVKVLLYNTTSDPYYIQKGDRIAQACVAPTIRISFAKTHIRGDETERGEGGFGSTGD